MPKRTDGLSRVQQMRAFRKNRKEKRRFESPLRQFVEIKYKDIFNEYIDLYQKMNDENPNKNDLTKTETFKNWKKQQQLDTDTLSQAIRETIGSEATSNTETHEYNTISNGINNDGSPGRQDHMVTPQQVDSDNGSPGRRDHVVTPQRIDSDNGSPGGQERMLAVHQIDTIVNEMINDDVLRELLNAGDPLDEDPQDGDPQDDEGIELNPWDEIDIEPFDFELEVETLEW